MISLISTKGSTLEKLSTTTLFAKGTTRYHQRVDLSSRIAVICLFDTVLLMYAEAATAVILCNTILNDVRGYRKSVASFSLFWASYNEGNECKRNHF